MVTPSTCQASTHSFQRFTLMRERPLSYVIVFYGIFYKLYKKKGEEQRKVRLYLGRYSQIHFWVFINLSSHFHPNADDYCTHPKVHDCC